MIDLMDTAIALRCTGLVDDDEGGQVMAQFSYPTTLGEAIWTVFGTKRAEIGDEAYELVVSEARSIVELLIAGEIESGDLLGSQSEQGSSHITITLATDEDIETMRMLNDGESFAA